ncbi:MAG: response regulator transcription factor [Ignavibacteriales bacterium]|nr:response regulator transcription factor [Ignavibacteriales bacterium]
MAIKEFPETEPDRLNVVIVEDNRYMRESWQTIIDFERDMRVSAAFANCEAALQSREIAQADVIIMDIELPGMSGIEGVKEIKRRSAQSTIIMATVFEDDKNVFQSLQSGAIGYLTKKVSTSELLAAIRTAHNGGSPMSPAIARKVIESLQSQPARKNPESILSDREREVLEYLADGKSYAAMAKAMFLSVDGVGYHIRNIYEKLQVNSRAEAVSVGLRKRLIRLFR